jgi:hypothetical protein
VPEPFHDLPDSIELDRADYRLVHAALEVALGVLDRSPEADPDGVVRLQVERALRRLLRRIWPLLDDLDDD